MEDLLQEINIMFINLVLMKAQYIEDAMVEAEEEMKELHKVGLGMGDRMEVMEWEQFNK